MLKDMNLIGSYTLVSHDQFSSATGQLIYSPDGSMSVLIFGKKPGAKPEDAEAVIAYGGNYRIEGNEVIHSIHYSKKDYPKGEQRRELHADQDLLILSALLEDKTKISISWKRKNS